jgi:hypothetical protein
VIQITLGKITLRLMEAGATAHRPRPINSPKLPELDDFNAVRSFLHAKYLGAWSDSGAVFGTKP